MVCAAVVILTWWVLAASLGATPVAAAFPMSGAAAT
jgi:hypothetical protein